MEEYFKRALIVSFSVIGGSGILFGVAWSVLAGDISSRAEKIATDKETLREHTAAVAAIANLKSQEPEAAQYRDAMAKLLVPEGRLLDFPKALNDLAQTRGVKINFSFQGNQVSATEDLPAYVNFSLGVNGTLENIVEFLKDVEFRSPQFLVQLKNVDLTESGSGYHIATGGKVSFK